MSRHTQLFALLIASLLATPAFAQSAAVPSGSADNPIVVHMKRGADTVQLKGVLKQGKDCCTYRFAASAGQTLIWRIDGKTDTHQAFSGPDESSDDEGPSLPPEIPLPSSGDYLFTVSPNLMSEQGFGAFTLTLKIPPLKKAAK
jgi:hypothetical protein